jgi:hypothetical protein
VEPSHLRWGTNADNMWDRYERKGYAVKYGDEVVSGIRAAYVAGVRQAEISRQFGVSRGYVSAIVLGRLRAH